MCGINITLNVVGNWRTRNDALLVHVWDRGICFCPVLATLAITASPCYGDRNEENTRPDSERVQFSINIFHVFQGGVYIGAKTKTN